ncbi:unnamed protein product [Camellia sinensis]
MPSGAKKRKSAKKKQQKEEANNNKNNSAIHSFGDDDPKVHDEKESDGGEAGSLASQDHHNHSHPFTEGDEEEMENREDTLTARSIVTESEPVVGISGNGKSTPNVAMDANSDIQIDQEMKHVDDSDRKNVSIEYVESVKESNGGQMSLDLGKNVSLEYVESVKESNSGRVSLDGGSSSSGSSSSDDESHVIEKNVVVIESGESKADDPNLAAESAAFADSVKPADLPEVTRATDGVPAMDACNLVVGEPKEEAYDPVAANAPPINLVEPSDFAEITPVTVGDLVIEGTTSLVDSENVSKTVVPVNDSLAIENSMHSTMFELGLKESGKNESSGVSSVVMDMGSQPKEDKVASKADENSSVSSGTGFATQEDEQAKPLASSSILAVDHSNGAGHVKDSVISECSDGQPLVASAPRLARTTSWMSCCGIFEFKHSMKEQSELMKLVILF